MRNKYFPTFVKYQKYLKSIDKNVLIVTIIEILTILSIISSIFITIELINPIQLKDFYFQIPYGLKLIGNMLIQIFLSYTTLYFNPASIFNNYLGENTIVPISLTIIALIPTIIGQVYLLKFYKQLKRHKEFEISTLHLINRAINYLILAHILLLIEEYLVTWAYFDITTIPWSYEPQILVALIIIKTIIKIYKDAIKIKKENDYTI